MKMAVKMDTLPCHMNGHTHASATCASVLALPALREASPVSHMSRLLTLRRRLRSMRGSIEVSSDGFSASSEMGSALLSCAAQGWGQAQGWGLGLGLGLGLGWG